MRIEEHRCRKKEERDDSTNNYRGAAAEDDERSSEKKNIWIRMQSFGKQHNMCRGDKKKSRIEN